MQILLFFNLGLLQRQSITKLHNITTCIYWYSYIPIILWFRVGKIIFHPLWLFRTENNNFAVQHVSGNSLIEILYALLEFPVTVS